MASPSVQMKVEGGGGGGTGGDPTREILRRNKALRKSKPQKNLIATSKDFSLLFSLAGRWRASSRGPVERGVHPQSLSGVLPPLHRGQGIQQRLVSLPATPPRREICTMTECEFCFLVAIARCISVGLGSYYVTIKQPQIAIIMNT